MKDSKKELRQMKLDLDIIQMVICSNAESKEFNKLLKEKQPLPKGVIASEMDDTFYRIVETDLTHEEVQELLLYKQITYIKTIKNSVLFFVALTIIGMLGALILSNMR
jgi:hypothetical protein